MSKEQLPEQSGVERINEDAIDGLKAHRDALARKGITSTITGVTAEEKRQMKVAGIEQRGMEANTQTESVRALQDAAEEGEGTVVMQLGSKEGQVIDPKGARAQANVEMSGVTQTQHSGDVSATIEGEVLTRRLNNNIAAGAKHVVFDLSRTREAKRDAEVNVDQAA